MPGPWEQYQTAPVGTPAPGKAAPWERYKPQGPRPTAGDILGDTWPVRIAKSIWSGLTLPGDVFTGKAQVFDPETGHVSDEAIQRGIDFSSIPLLSATGAPPGALGSGLTRAAAAKAATGTAVAQAAERIGVDIPRAAATDSMLLQRMGQLAANTPIGGGAMREAADKARNQLGAVVEDVARVYGGGKVASPYSAGGTARDALTNYIGPVTKERANKAYRAVDELIDPSVTTPLSSTTSTALDILAKRKEAALRGPGAAVDLVREGVSRPQGLTYEGVKGLRTRAGELQDTGILPADMSHSELKRVYGGLSEDLRSAALNAGGQEGLAKFDRANRYYSLLSKRRENLVRLLGAKNDEGVFDALSRTAGSSSKADLNLLLQARKAMPGDAWDDVASGVIAKMGRPNAGESANAGAAAFSPEKFATEWAKMTPQGRSILFRSTGKGDLAKALDDIVTVSQRFKQLQRLGNSSGTGQQVIGFSQAAGAASQITAAMMGAIDPLTAAASVTASIGGPWLMAKILSKPATARAMANWSKAYVGGKRLAVSYASKRLAQEIGQEFGLAKNVPALAAAFEDAGGGPPGNAQAQPQQ